MLRALYVRGMRGARWLARVSGLLGWLERRGAGSRVALWLRSMFAIYDTDDMIRLDLPWWNLEAVGVVDRFLSARPGARVLEFGSGASSTWLAKRCGELVSIEHDAQWAAIVERQLAGFPHADLWVRPPVMPGAGPGAVRSGKRGVEGDFRDYVDAIDGVDGRFDVIVIDGRCRALLLGRALDRLAEGGVVVFDNSERARYRAAFERDDIEIERYRGLTACLPYPDATWLVRRRGGAGPGAAA